MYTLALVPQVFRDKARRAAGSGSTRKRRNAGSGNLGYQPHKPLKQGLGRFCARTALRLPCAESLHGSHRALFARKSDSSASVYIIQCFPKDNA